ncbi:gamma-soluble NSF attachment protein [Ciona intestinalis]
MTSEADRLVQEGEKHLKTGFFKWRPDFDSAADCFQKAGLAYKKHKNLEKAVSAFLKVADCYYKNGSRFHSGKAREEAGLVYKDMKDFENALKCLDHASELYLEDGTPDTAAMCLDRAGKMVEMTHPAWAASSYLKGAEIYENEDKSRFRSAAELVGKAARIQVRMNKLSEAVKTIEHEKQLYSQVDGGDHGAGSRLTCAMVLVHLHIGDQVHAEQSVYDACENIDGFSESEEYDALMGLVEAYDQRDQDAASRILNTPLFKYMDTAYAKLARSLKVPGYMPGNAVKTESNSHKPRHNLDDMTKQADEMADKFASLQSSVPNPNQSNQTPQSTPAAVEEEFDLC